MGRAAASGPLSCGGDGFLTGAGASRDYRPHTKERSIILITRLIPKPNSFVV